MCLGLQLLLFSDESDEDPDHGRESDWRTACPDSQPQSGSSSLSRPKTILLAMFEWL